MTDLPLNDQFRQKSIIYSLAKFGLFNSEVEQLCRDFLENPSELYFSLLINTVMYLALVRSIDSAFFRARPEIEKIFIKNLSNPRSDFYIVRIAYLFARLQYYDSPFLL